MTINLSYDLSYDSKWSEATALGGSATQSKNRFKDMLFGPEKF